MNKIVTFTWYSADMFHYVLKAEFVTLGSLKVPSGCRLHMRMCWCSIKKKPSGDVNKVCHIFLEPHQKLAGVATLGQLWNAYLGVVGLPVLVLLAVVPEGGAEAELVVLRDVDGVLQGHVDSPDILLVRGHELGVRRLLHQVLDLVLGTRDVRRRRRRSFIKHL